MNNETEDFEQDDGEIARVILAVTEKKAYCSLLFHSTSTNGALNMRSI